MDLEHNSFYGQILPMSWCFLNLRIVRQIKNSRLSRKRIEGTTMFLR